MFWLNKCIDEDTGLHGYQLGNGAHSVTIVPEAGAAVLALILSNQVIVKAPKPLPAPGAFAGALLFPFANRVAGGHYVFQDVPHQLPCNEETGKNALHGLVYNQPFTVREYKLHETYASLQLGFEATENHFKGFPFPFKITVSYTLRANQLEVGIEIENNGSSPFPYQLGWHPYFYAPAAQSRRILLNASGNFLLDNALLPAAFIPSEIRELPLNKAYDDCYALRTNEVVLEHGTTALRLSSTTQPNYLQVFTPPDKDLVAIEFMSAPSNCFNTGTDVLVLQANATEKAGWRVQLISATP